MNEHIETLEKARRFLVARRRHLSSGIVKLSDGDFDRVMRHAEYMTAVQNAIEAIGRAIRDEDAAGDDEGTAKLHPAE